MVKLMQQMTYVWAEKSQFEKYNLPNDKTYVKSVVYNEIIILKKIIFQTMTLNPRELDRRAGRQALPLVRIKWKLIQTVSRFIYL